MTTIIDKKITGFAVKEETTNLETTNLETMKRPKFLPGGTYKIKPPAAKSALYLTITSIEVDGKVRPYEIFVNSKDPAHYQWVIALTRTVSAVFRKGGEVGFIIDELKEVFDPAGGYFSDGKFINSLVADIGWSIEDYLYEIGFRTKEELSDMQRKLIDTKKEALNVIPNTSTVCPKCSAKAVVMMDGCSTCLSCADSKCG